VPVLEGKRRKFLCTQKSGGITLCALLERKKKAPVPLATNIGEKKKIYEIWSKRWKMLLTKGLRGKKDHRALPLARWNIRVITPPLEKIDGKNCCGLGGLGRGEPTIPRKSYA